MLVSVIYLPKLYIHHYYHGVIVILKTQQSKPKCSNRRSGREENPTYETYKNTVMAHGRHIYTKAYDMAKAKMCAYPHSDHALPHCECTENVSK